MVSHFPFHVFNDALFYDFESEEMQEPLDALVPSCYNESGELNIDEFMHVGRHKWDVVCYDGDPICDIEGNFQLFPLQQTYVIASNLDVWEQENDMVVGEIYISSTLVQWELTD
jgi:hypothetical protein